MNGSSVFHHPVSSSGSPSSSVRCKGGLGVGSELEPVAEPVSSQFEKRLRRRRDREHRSRLDEQIAADRNIETDGRGEHRAAASLGDAHTTRNLYRHVERPVAVEARYAIGMDDIGLDLVGEDELDVALPGPIGESGPLEADLGARRSVGRADGQAFGHQRRRRCLNDCRCRWRSRRRLSDGYGRRSRCRRRGRRGRHCRSTGGCGRHGSRRDVR